MFKSISYENFRLLRNARLPLGQLTLIVGPNGSGKSSALVGLTAHKAPLSDVELNVSLGSTQETLPKVSFVYEYEVDGRTYLARARHNPHGLSYEWFLPPGEAGGFPPLIQSAITRDLASARVYSLDAGSLATPVDLVPQAELDVAGRGLAVVMDRLRDEAPERFVRLNEDLATWLPEFDRVLFQTPGHGMRAIALRRRSDKAVIPAQLLSQGTLLAMALLTLSHLPQPPALLGLEEPGRGIHPRLLRDVRDALYRLSYPGSDEGREPVQVVVTTHSPYMLDLFRDHPEEIVIAERTEDEVSFERLADRTDLAELTAEVHLGDLWYSGVLGGVPDTK